MTAGGRPHQGGRGILHRRTARERFQVDRRTPAGDPALLRVDELAGGLGMGTRRLQRIFAEYVGVGPKWVIRRYRMQEAAERAGNGAGVDWAALSAELGYADQAHFTRDFSRAIGTSPAQYARDC
jgi:AraC-like DNA-binding protein